MLDDSFQSDEVTDSFDSAAECRATINTYLKQTKEFKSFEGAQSAKDFEKVGLNNTLRYIALFARCIASDDPRLKDK